MLENNVFAYLNGSCTDLEFIKYTHIGENKPGSVIKYDIFKVHNEESLEHINNCRKSSGKKRAKLKKDPRVHYFYVVKRPNLYDSYAEKYTEMKILDLNPKNGNVTCLYKERFFEEAPSCKDFWEEVHNYSTVRDKIDFYLDTIF